MKNTVKLSIMKITIIGIISKSLNIINDFEYFEPLFIAYFKLLIHDNQKDKSLDNYLRVSIDTLHMQVTRLIKLFVPIIYCFVAGFVILVYVAIVIPMMNVVSNL